MKALFRIAAILLLSASFAASKTKMLVEDPNNVVVGRYLITAEQKARSEQAAITALSIARQKDVQKALAIRYVVVDAGPLTAEQQRHEPSSIKKAQKRFARYGVSMDPNQPLYPIVIYDTAKHRIVHNRIYTVTALPELNYVGRFDDYHAMYLGGISGTGQTRKY